MLENANKNLNENTTKSKVYALHIEALKSLINDPPESISDSYLDRELDRELKSYLDSIAETD